MNASTAMSPAPLESQKRRDGRSWARRTAATAVAAGRNAITTAPWAAVSVCSASEVNSGKPTTTPPAVIASDRTWRRVGRGARVAVREAAARAAAAVGGADGAGPGAGAAGG